MSTRLFISYEPHQIGCFPEIPRRQWPDVQQPPLLSAPWALFVKLGTAVPTHNVTGCYAKFFPIFHPHAWGGQRPGHPKFVCSNSLQPLHPPIQPRPMHNSAQFRPTTNENYRPNPKKWGYEYPESFRTISTNSQLPIVLPLRPTTAQDGRKAICGHDHQRPAVSRR